MLSGCVRLFWVQQFVNAPSLSGAYQGYVCVCVFNYNSWVMGDQPPRCFGVLMASFKYSARICRMAMRFVKARFEKHLRVPFLHTL